MKNQRAKKIAIAIPTKLAILLFGLLGTATPIRVAAQCGPQPSGNCTECGPHWGPWSYVCPAINNTPGVNPTEIDQCVGSLQMPSVTPPTYSSGYAWRTGTYDCSSNTSNQTNSITFTVGSVYWNPSLPSAFTNCTSFTSTAYVNVTSSDTNCPSPGQVSIGSCTWYAIQVTLGNTNIWWFNGASPANYTLSTTASACGAPAGASLVWNVSGPAGFSGSGGSITITGTGPSTGVGDVTVQVTVNGAGPCPTNLTVLAPSSQDNWGVIDSPNGAGYESEIIVEIDDQFLRVLPQVVPWDEDIDGNGLESDSSTVSVAAISDYSGETWSWGPEGGTNVNPSIAVDAIRRNASSPASQNPNNPLGTTKVDHSPGGAWYCGGIAGTVGNPKIGVKIASCVWQTYLDHGRHRGYPGADSF